MEPLDIVSIVLFLVVLTGLNIWTKRKATRAN